MILRLAVLVFFIATLLPAHSQPLSKEQILEAMPHYEAYVEQARQDWGVPRVAVAVVYDDEMIWWKGFGKEPPDQETVFAIGSTTKAFAAATLAIMVDEGGPGWDAKVVDHLPGFAMYDPWVTREFQVDDLLAQHSGMPQQVLSGLGAMGYSADRIVSALRWVEPVSSFRSRFAYVNSPHLVAGNLVAKWAGADSWETVLKKRILDPLGMKTTTWTAEGLDGNPNSATGHARVNGQINPITAGPFPYVFGPAGSLNSNLHDLSRWVRLQLNNGEFEGKRIVSEQNLLVTRTPQTVLGPSIFYCMGWLNVESHGHPISWHNGGTPGHTTFIGLQPQDKLGVIVLSNLGGTEMPDAVGLRFFDLIRGYEGPDYNKQYLNRHKPPQYPPVLEKGFLPEMAGEYHHPALGKFTVDRQQKVLFHDTGLQAVIEPIGPNLFQLRVPSGWLTEIGWARMGEFLYSPSAQGQEASFTVSIGEPGETTPFKAHRLKSN